jgi:predicted DNA-binding transcriptional regulator YafY
LQAHGLLSGRELAERLEVSQRTIHRDMEALSVAGVPIAALRGAQGGWRLDKDWRTQVPGLDAAELNALLMTQPRALGDPRLIAASERAFAKLVAALPGPMRQQAAAMRERLHVDSTGWHPMQEDLSMLAVVQDAVTRDGKLAFDYTRADGQKAPRTVDPLGIVAKGASWYLVARTARGLRTYRVSRMEAVTPLAITFQRPANFNLEKFWKRSMRQLEQQRSSYKTILFVDPKAARSLDMWCKTFPAPERAMHAPEDWVTKQVEFESEEQARFVILGLGSKAQVVSPEKLREQILEETRKILQLETRQTELTAGRRKRKKSFGIAAS